MASCREMQLIKEGSVVTLGLSSPLQSTAGRCVRHIPRAPSACGAERQTASEPGHLMPSNMAQPPWRRSSQCCHLLAKIFGLCISSAQLETLALPDSSLCSQKFGILSCFCSFKCLKKIYQSSYLQALLKEGIKDALPLWMVVWIKHWAGRKLCGLFRI